MRSHAAAQPPATLANRAIHAQALTKTPTAILRALMNGGALNLSRQDLMPLSAPDLVSVLRN
jgi:hypothetical protein